MLNPFQNAIAIIVYGLICIGGFILFLGVTAYIIIPILLVLFVLYVIKVISGTYVIKISPNLTIKKQPKKKEKANQENIIDVDYTEIK